MANFFQTNNWIAGVKSRITKRWGYVLGIWFVLLISLSYFQNFEDIPYALLWMIGISSTLLIFSLGESVPNNTFLIIIVIGIFYSFTMPIQDNPDEHAHLARAFYISEGNWGMTDESSQLFISQDFEKIKAEEGKNGDNLKKEYHTEEKGLAEIITATSTNSFISYLPQTAGLTIGRLFHFNLYWTYYLGRMFNLLAYAFLARIAVRLSNVWKLPVAFVSMTPMSLFLAASFNQDSVSLGLVLVTIGYFLNIIYKESPLLTKDLVIYSFLCCLVATTKLPYVALVGLLLFLPVTNLTKKKDYFKILISIGVVGIVTLVWLLSYLNITPVHISKNADAILQLKYLSDNPAVIWQVLVNSFFDNIRDYTMMFKFGWLSYGSLEASLLHLFFFGFVSLMFPVSKKMPRITKRGFTTVMLVIIILINLSQYLTWTEVGLNYVSGVQGRYFIGIFAMMPMVFNLFEYFKIEIVQSSLLESEKKISLFINFIVILFLIVMLCCQIAQYSSSKLS